MGLFPSMNPLLSLEMRNVTKSLSTIRTMMWLLSSMDYLIILPTYGTLSWLFPSMDYLMSRDDPLKQRPFHTENIDMAFLQCVFVDELQEQKVQQRFCHVFCLVFDC